MAHGYRTLQHWNQWLAQNFLGHSLLEAEHRQLARVLANHCGKHALLIGVAGQYRLLNATPIPCHSLVSPLFSKEHNHHYIEGDFHDLPIATGSIDLVLLPHTLEFVDNPRQLLVEAMRVVKPEGLIVICGFNPYSMWGLRKFFSKHKSAPWSGNFLQAHKIKGWLGLADFALENQYGLFFAPPISRKSIYNKFKFLEQIGNKFAPPCGGVYMLIARAKVIPLTPIKMKWKQQLSGIGIPSTMTGHIARQSK